MSFFYHLDKEKFREKYDISINRSDFLNFKTNFLDKNQRSIILPIYKLYERYFYDFKKQGVDFKKYDNLRRFVNLYVYEDIRCKYGILRHIKFYHDLSQNKNMDYICDHHYQYMFSYDEYEAFYHSIQLMINTKIIKYYLFYDEAKNFKPANYSFYFIPNLDGEHFFKKNVTKNDILSIEDQKLFKTCKAFNNKYIANLIISIYVMNYISFFYSPIGVDKETQLDKLVELKLFLKEKNNNFEIPLYKEFKFDDLDEKKKFEIQECWEIFENVIYNGKYKDFEKLINFEISEKYQNDITKYSDKKIKNILYFFDFLQNMILHIDTDSYIFQKVIKMKEYFTKNYKSIPKNWKKGILNFNKELYLEEVKKILGKNNQSYDIDDLEQWFTKSNKIIYNKNNVIKVLNKQNYGGYKSFIQQIQDIFNKFYITEQDSYFLGLTNYKKRLVGIDKFWKKLSQELLDDLQHIVKGSYHYEYDILLANCVFHKIWNKNEQCNLEVQFLNDSFDIIELVNNKTKDLVPKINIYDNLINLLFYEKLYIDSMSIFDTITMYNYLFDLHSFTDKNKEIREKIFNHLMKHTAPGKLEYQEGSEKKEYSYILKYYRKDTSLMKNYKTEWDRLKKTIKSV